MSKGRLTLFCPNHHQIPNKTPNGECTPLYCAGETRRESKRVKVNQRKEDHAVAKSAFEVRRADAIIKATKELELEVLRTPLPLPDGASEMLVNEGRLETLGSGSVGLGKHRARLAFIKDLPAEDADEVTINNWTDARTVKLLPLAVAEKEFQLRFGDDNQRERAADAVLRMTGRYQKEGAISGGASIILNIGGEGGMQLPYMPRKEVTVNAEPSKESDAEKLP